MGINKKLCVTFGIFFLVWFLPAISLLAEILPEPPRITVPYTTVPPILDGKINPEEWQQASLVTGFHPNCGKKMGEMWPVRAYFMYDKHALYIGMQCPYTGRKTQVRSEDRVSTGDKICWTEDDIEIFLQPAGDSKSYMLMANLDGEKGDLILGSPPGYNRDWTWRGDWQVKTNKKEDGWEVEVRIPFSAFGHKTPAEGEIWRGNFGQTCKLYDAFVSWSHGGPRQSTPFHPPERFGELYFTRLLPAVRCPEWLNSEEVKLGHVEGHLELIGQKREVPINCSIVLKDRTSEMEMVRREVLLYPSKKIVAEMIATTSVSGSYLVRIQAKTKEAVIFSQEFFYEIDSRMLATELLYWPSREELEIEVKLNPYQLPKEFPPMVNLRCRMIDQAGQRVLQRENILVKAGDNKPHKFIFSFKGLPPGRYRFLTDIPNKNYSMETMWEGKYFTEDYFEYYGSPPWLFKGRHLGEIDYPISPWTPIEMKNGTFRCWGREYLFGKSILPEQITSQGRSLLKSPINFILKEKGRTSSPDGVITEIESTTPCQAILSGKGRLGSFDLYIRTQMEFDGFMWFDCTFSPSQETVVENLTLEIPLNPEYALFYMTQGVDLGASEGDLQKRIGAKVYRVGKGSVFLSVVENIFFGDGKVGLSWCVESDKNWINRTPEKALEISKTENEVIFRCNIIDTPWEINKPFTISFSLTASPVRPLRRGWQSYAIDYSRWPEGEMQYVSSARPVMPMSYDAGGSDGQYQSTPDARDPDLLRAAIEKVHRYGNFICPYLACTHIHNRDPVYNIFKNEWFNGVSSYDPETYLMYHGEEDRLNRVNLFADSWKDYFLTLYKDYLAEFDVDGFYFDNTFADATYNPHHTSFGTYTDAFGRKKYIRPIRQLRELNKKTYILAHQAKGDRAYVIRGGVANLAYMSFADAYVSEDYVPDGIKDYINEVSWERSLLCYSPHRGIPTHIIPFLDMRPERIIPATNSMLAQNLQARVLLWNIMCDVNTVKKFEAAVQDFFPYDPKFISDEEIRMSGLATTDTKDIKICAYLLSNQVMLGISNFGNQDANVKIHLNFKSLGLVGDDVRAIDLLTKRKLSLTQDQLFIQINAKSYLLIGLTTGEEKEMEKSLRNGDFEKPFQRNGIGVNWKQANDQDDSAYFSLSREKSYSGTFSQKVKIFHVGNGIQQVCPVEKGRRYKISAWVYIVQGHVALTAGHVQNHRAYGVVETNEPNKWKNLTLEVESIENDLVLTISSTDEGAEFYIDNVSLEAT